MFDDESALVDEWLDQNDFSEYKKLFREYGISTLSGCGSPDQLDRLPELPAAEEKRLRRAAQVLQQRLVLRQWLATHRLQHTYTKLLSLDVSSLEDVYWLEDSTARHVLDPKDFGAWSAARQSLPTGKDALQTLKADLWSAVVKNSKHQDAWTWGGMLVVSVSVCGLVTLAAMTQPSLAPEAKHSLLQYVTGKYLHPPSCKVEWGWTEPQAVGETMCFTVHCYQRNGHPYPICDTDELSVSISHGTRKVTAVIELGSGDPAQANTARVKFTVRTAGVYIVSIMIGLVHISGSPYRKWFTAGRVEARRSRVGRAHHALVWAAGHARHLHVHPRDQYDNPAPLTDQEPPAVSYYTRAGVGGAPPALTTHALVWAARHLHVHPRDQYDNPAPLTDQEPPAVSYYTRAGVGARHLHVHPRDQYDNPAPLTDQEPPAVSYYTRAGVGGAPPARAPARPVRQPRAAHRPGAARFTTHALVWAARHLHVHPRDQYDNPAPLTDQEPPAVSYYTRAGVGARHLHVHPRDQYDNPAPLTDQEPPAGFSIKINPLGGPVDEQLSSSATFAYDAVNQRVSLALCFERAGVYRAQVLYEGVLLHNGEFDCIVLTASDTATVQRNISSKRHNISYEARLLTGKQRRVLCCISPKQLTLKDYILKFIPKRITSFRLCPSTKLILKPTPAGSGPGGEFTLEDGVQPQLELVSAERDLIAATFTQLLIANCGGEDTFKNKQDFFYSEIRKAHARHPHEKLAIRVLRSELLRTSLKATRHFTVQDWCKNFDVTFQGEQGVDWGGVRREWFSLLCGQLFDSKFGLFVSFHDSPTGLVHPNPDRPPHLKLKHFELAGKLVGKCLYESALGGSYRQLVRARLTRSFLAQIIGLRVHYKYFEQDDPELYLSKIKYVLETDLDAGDAVPELYFCDDVYDAHGRLVETHDLLPNGSTIRVRNSSKIAYLDALAQWRLAARVRTETDAFLRGLTLLVPDNLLAIFDENELELLVCGTGEVSVADWRAHALVSGAGRDWERLLSWFWAALANFSTEERARLLQFTTGCSQLPSGGFQRLLSWFWAALANFSTEERARLLQFTTGCSQLPSGGFQVSYTRARVGRGPRLGAPAQLVLGRARQLQHRGARQAAAVHHGLLAATFRRLPVTHALVSGAGRDWERLLSWFWAALANFSTEERARLLQFTTGCSQLPSGGFQVSYTRARVGRGPRLGAPAQLVLGRARQLQHRGARQAAAVHHGLLAATFRRLPVTHALVSGAGRDWERLLSWFWAALANFSTEERARLLQFTTGCSQLPSGGFQVSYTRARVGRGPRLGAPAQLVLGRARQLQHRGARQAAAVHHGLLAATFRRLPVTHALVSGAGRDWERLLSWFWAALANFSTEERARLLQFTTGCSQLPSGGFQVSYTRARVGRGPRLGAPAQLVLGRARQLQHRGARQAAAVHHGLLAATFRRLPVTHALVSGAGRDWERLLSWFWAALANFSTEERARLLQFTTGCSQLPSGGFQVSYTRARVGRGPRLGAPAQLVLGRARQLQHRGARQAAAVHHGLLAATFRRLPVTHALVSGAGRDWERLLSWFWAALANFSTEERARLLQFTTGCSQLPSGGFQVSYTRARVGRGPRLGAPAQLVLGRARQLQHRGARQAAAVHHGLLAATFRRLPVTHALVSGAGRDWERLLSWFWAALANFSTEERARLLQFTTGCSQLPSGGFQVSYTRARVGRGPRLGAPAQLVLGRARQLQHRGARQAAAVHHGLLAATFRRLPVTHALVSGAGRDWERLLSWFWAALANFSTEERARLLQFTTGCSQLPSGGFQVSYTRARVGRGPRLGAPAQLVLGRARQLQHRGARQAAAVHHGLLAATFRRLPVTHALVSGAGRDWERLLSWFWAALANFSTEERARLLQFTTGCSQLPSGGFQVSYTRARVGRGPRLGAPAQLVLGRARQLQHRGARQAAAVHHGLLAATFRRLPVTHALVSGAGRDWERLLSWFWAALANFSTEERARLLQFTTGCSQLPSGGFQVSYTRARVGRGPRLGAPAQLVLGRARQLQHRGARQAAAVHHGLLAATFRRLPVTHALVSGAGRDWERLLSWFWAALANFSTEERARLLQFTTGCSQLPSGGFQVSYTRARVGRGPRLGAPAQLVLGRARQLQHRGARQAAAVHHGLLAATFRRLPVTHALVSGAGRDWERLLSWFWAALANFSTEERARLLQFTTGCSQLPSGGFQVSYTRARVGRGPRLGAPAQLVLGRARQLQHRGARQAAAVHHGLLAATFRRLPVTHALVSGAGRDWERLLSWFWAALANFSTEERARLLQFTTGCSQLPSGGFQVSYTRARVGRGPRLGAPAQLVLGRARQLQHRGARQAAAVHHGLLAATFRRLPVTHALVSGAGRDWERLLSWFWAALANFSTEERARLLQFTTGCSQLPSGGFQVSYTRARVGRGPRLGAPAQLVLGRARQLQHRGARQAAAVHHGLLAATFRRLPVTHALVSGAGRDWERLLSWFWAALANFSTEERARLLQFTTGCSQLPSGGFQVSYTRARVGRGPRLGAPAQLVLGRARQLQHRGARQAAAVHHGLLAATFRRLPVTHALVSGAGRDWERLLSWFWAALANFSTEERARLLQFTTGCSQLPSGGFQVSYTRARVGRGPRLGAPAQLVLGRARQLQHRGARQAAAVHHGLLAATFRRLPVTHALVSGAGRDWERLLSWFWAALANFSTEERARLLQFTTGCSQLPSGGFQELNPRFQITAAPNFGALPTAHTCFNQLCLPDYDSYEQLVHALLWAINEGGEGFGMI
ncbi:hypothetical protein PYW08_001909 [Mythimna loreyi]|uniref:Uncharacterized protein n=1 Tax=Mythimna loreyi TaxID=667449 RepID=A0ACC2R0T9_9NEOP|nr:hypothetical protein PYW08_001909 [Mythimna loreyi]